MNVLINALVSAILLRMYVQNTYNYKDTLIRTFEYLRQHYLEFVMST